MKLAKNYLEPKFKPDFDAWKTDPSPGNVDKLLTHLRPTIDRNLAFTAGRNSSPALLGQAKQLAINALQSYDPGQSALKTHVTNHLQGLRRIARQQSQILSVPERVTLDSAYLHEMEQEFIDEYDREPSMQELSDRSGLSSRRIKHVKGFAVPAATGTMDAMSVDGEGDGISPAVRYDNTDTYLHAIYDDLGPIDQKIMEWTLGYGGANKLTNQEIAAKLKITPGAISQRKAKIQQQLIELQGSKLFG
jgi:DNA-directed RNA polymerase specialized sigma subunit